MPHTSKSRRKPANAFRLAGGNVATSGVAFIARVEGASTAADAQKKLDSVLGHYGATPLYTSDGSVQVRVYFGPNRSRVLGEHEIPVEILPPEPKTGVSV